MLINCPFFFGKHSIKENNEKGELNSFNEKDVRGTEIVFNSLSEFSNVDVDHLNNLKLPTTSCDEQFLAGTLVVKNKELPPITKSVLDMYLTLSKKHYATEPILLYKRLSVNQMKLSKCAGKNFQILCRKLALMKMLNQLICKTLTAVSVTSQTLLMEKKGFLRNSYNRKIYYQQNLN